MKPWTFLDKLVWKVANWATKFAIRPLIFLGITPNQLTVWSFLFFIPVAAYFFSKGEYIYNILGLIFCLFHTFHYVNLSYGNSYYLNSIFFRYLLPGRGGRKIHHDFF